MKLISNLDVNGNNFINGSLTLQLPDATGTKTIATTDDLAQFGGAFKFKGTAIRIKADTDPANSTIVVAGETQGSEVEIVAAAANSGHVYQIADKEYASNGTVWVELGFNIDLSAYLTSADAAETYLTIDDAADTYLSIDDAADTYLTIDDAADTYLAQDDFEEASEVISAALNDLNSRTSDIEDKLDGVESGAEVNVIEGVILSDSVTALTPDANKNVTIPNATTSADGLMSSEDKTKLNGIASGAEANVQADWTEADTTSDAYIANKPTNLAVAYLATYTTAQTNNTVTIAKATHGCGDYPMIQVFAGNDVVSANVSVSNDGGDVTVSWAGIDPTQTAIRVRIVGCPTETAPAQNNEPAAEPEGE